MELQNCCDYCKYCRTNATGHEGSNCRLFHKAVKLSDYCAAWEERKHTCSECKYFLCEGMCNVQHKDSCDVFEGSAACSKFCDKNDR